MPQLKTKRFICAVAVVLVGTGWYLSGRDFRKLQDGLSRNFRDSRAGGPEGY